MGGVSVPTALRTVSVLLCMAQAASGPQTNHEETFPPSFGQLQHTLFALHPPRGCFHFMPNCKFSARHRCVFKCLNVLCAVLRCAVAGLALGAVNRNAVAFVHIPSSRPNHHAAQD